MSEKKTDARFRNWATVVYPESAPKNWQEILEQQFIPAFISPLHDKDQNPNGEAKKPHYHVIVMFEGKKSKDQVKCIFDLIGGVGIEKVNSLRGYARYLCHLDNPEKAKYDEADVLSLGGADYIGVIGLVIDKYKAIGEIIDFCDAYTIYSYSDLLLYCKNNRFDWFRVLCDNGTFVIKEYLQSKKWTDDQKVDRDKWKDIQ